MGYDDTLDAFGIHGIGGIVGAILLTFFIRDSWMAEAAAGGTWTVLQQLGVQATAVAAAVAYSALVTTGIVFTVNRLIGLRNDSENEMAGLDHAYHGERGYGMLNAC
jgi:Amt family ammonium transporter